jgi:hydroxymethylpyrimidine/phosphomethylpyrimidine kinase
VIARVLIVAGSDSGGGAGIQADIKTVTALGGYASTAITALTAQNTLGVQGVVPVATEFVALQLRAVLADIGADAIKTGMLFSRELIDTVTNELSAHEAIPLVVDPVMVAKGGQALLLEEARAALVTKLFPRATLVTPNVPEAEVLTGGRVETAYDLARAAERLLELGPQAVLVKGGHLPGDRVVDVLRARDGTRRRFEGPRIDTRSTHGTGCTLASAIATGLGERLPLEAAIARARGYLQGALERAPGFGQGHGPLHHGWTFSSLRRTDG